MTREWEGVSLRLNVLAETRFGGVVIRGHVARATAARGEDAGLEGGCLEVARGEARLAGSGGDVAGATAAVGGDHVGCLGGRRWCK